MAEYDCEASRYTLQKITAPVAIIFDLGDWVADVRDVAIIAGQLTHLIDNYEVPVL